MKLTKGLILILAGSAGMVFSITLAQTTGLSAIQYSIGLLSLAVSCFGISRLFDRYQLERRIIISNRILLTAFIIIVAAFLLSFIEKQIAYFLMLFGFFLLAFAFIPLLSKNRVQKWRQYTRKAWHTYMLAYSDLLSLSAVIVGCLFKFLNWPGANLLLTIGLSVLIVTLFGWNKLFSKEVVLRKEAEEKIAVAYEHLNVQAEKIKEKNDEILDSITYANRIQQSLLTRDSVFTSHLDEHFIFYQPKDIVAGDFYWGSHCGNGFIYITADCTGHGVPGAFMSLLNISKLNEYVLGRELNRPDEILNYIRQDIVRILNAGENEAETKDGMDCVLIHVDVKSRTLLYSAANNNFYIVRGGDILNFEGDKMPVGKFEIEKPFTCREVKLQPGDMIYTFTDGYADQFGGPKGKKFKYKQFESLLISISRMDPAAQRLKLRETFEAWRADLEQVDDVCVIGVRLN